MLVLAHRGYHADLPENTLPAFEAARRLGIDGIETDVRLSADGKAVIMHDRVTPAGRAISSITHREIERDVGHAVPLLNEILEAIPDVLWNIEIKTPAAWPVALPVLRHYHVVMRCATELRIDCGLLLASRPVDVAATLAGCSGMPAIRSIVWDYNIVDEVLLQQVAAAGWRNYVYGAVTAEEHVHCGRLGLAGLITDHPERAARRS